MQVEELSIPDVKILTPKKHGDGRGFFSETYSRRSFAETGIDITSTRRTSPLAWQS